MPFSAKYKANCAWLQRVAKKMRKEKRSKLSEPKNVTKTSKKKAGQPKIVS